MSGFHVEPFRNIASVRANISIRPDMSEWMHEQVSGMGTWKRPFQNGQPQDNLFGCLWSKPSTKNRHCTCHHISQGQLWNTCNTVGVLQLQIRLLRLSALYLCYSHQLSNSSTPSQTRMKIRTSTHPLYISRHTGTRLTPGNALHQAGCHLHSTRAQLTLCMPPSKRNKQT